MIAASETDRRLAEAHILTRFKWAAGFYFNRLEFVMLAEETFLSERLR